MTSLLTLHSGSYCSRKWCLSVQCSCSTCIRWPRIRRLFEKTSPRFHHCLVEQLQVLCQLSILRNGLSWSQCFQGPFVINDQPPRWTWHSPHQYITSYSQHRNVEGPDMWLFHEDDCHYDLLVPWEVVQPIIHATHPDPIQHLVQPINLSSAEEIEFADTTSTTETENGIM